MLEETYTKYSDPNKEVCKYFFIWIGGGIGGSGVSRKTNTTNLIILTILIKETRKLFI